MPALYTITTRASGTILTAAMYNSDHQNHVNNGDASHLGAFSANTSQMRTQTSPGDPGSESLSLSIADELARIRYMIALQRGTTFWYGTSASYPGSSGNNYLRNSNFLTASRQGQANKGYAASAGSPYTFDQFYLLNGANQACSVNYNPPIIVNDNNCLAVNRTAGQTGVSQMWIGQPFTLAQLIPLLGKQVSIGVSFTTGSGWTATSITLQLLGGTGVAGKFSSGFTNLVTIATTGGITTNAGMAVTRIAGTGVVPANITQMEWRVVWTPVGTAPATDTISLAQGKLELGSVDTPYIAPDPYIELAELEAWYWKSFPLGINPAQNTGNTGAIGIAQMLGAAAPGNASPSISFPRRMIAIPTITTYNPGAANNQIRNSSVAADCSGTTPGVSENSFRFVFTTAAGSSAGNTNLVHVTADAGL